MTLETVSVALIIQYTHLLSSSFHSSHSLTCSTATVIEHAKRSVAITTLPSYQNDKRVLPKILGILHKDLAEEVRSRFQLVGGRRGGRDREQEIP